MRTVVGWLTSLSLIATTTVAMTTMAVAQQTSRPTGTPGVTTQQRPTKSGNSTFNTEPHGNLNKKNETQKFDLVGKPKSDGARPSGSGGMYKNKEKE